MLFNSSVFLVFFLVFFTIYWSINAKPLIYQNLFLLVSSYVFYGWWDYRFLSLIFLSTLMDYIAGLRIYNADSQRVKRIWLTVSIVFNLGLLGYFKYFNFFLESFYDLTSKLGFDTELLRFDIILPVGISFYTFQTMSYSIDIFKGNLKPTKNFIDFAAFVSFFPQLVAGPIERASNLLPQISEKRVFDVNQAFLGLKLILFGLFKKVVIADSLAPVVNETFANYDTVPGTDLILGAVFFAGQIYGDFSGYSDIAIGLSLLLGFRLMKNFNFPYFSKNISEFWKRWHISLSSWFRDYLYIPLGGNRKGFTRAIINVAIIFLVSGFWHGANWTFIVWGGIHALFYIPAFIGRNKFNAEKKRRPLFGQYSFGFISGLFTFIVVCFAWIFFRAESISHAFDYIQRIHYSGFSLKQLLQLKYILYLVALDLVILNFPYLSKRILKNVYIRYSLYSILILSILSHSTNVGSDFIYFQF